MILSFDSWLLHQAVVSSCKARKPSVRIATPEVVMTTSLNSKLELRRNNQCKLEAGNEKSRNW